MSISHLPSLAKQKSQSQENFFPTAVSGRDTITESTRMAFDDFYKNGIYPPSSEAERIRKMLEENEIYFAKSGNYIQSHRCTLLIKDLDEKLKTVQQEEKKEQEIDKIQGQIKEQEENMQEIENKWNKEMKNFVLNHEDKIEKVQNKQKMDMYYFCDNFEKPDNLAKYAKPSIELLDMRARERILLLTNRFNEAQAEESKANEFQENEIQQKQDAAEKEVQDLIDKFSIQQAQEIEKMDNRARFQLGELRRKKDIEMETAKARLNKLQTDLDLAKNSHTSGKESSIPLQTQLMVQNKSKQTSQARKSTALIFRQENISTKLKVYDENNRMNLIHSKKSRSQQSYRPKTKEKPRMTYIEKLKSLPQFDI